MKPNVQPRNPNLAIGEFMSPGEVEASAAHGRSIAHILRRKAIEAGQASDTFRFPDLIKAYALNRRNGSGDCGFRYAVRRAMELRDNLTLTQSDAAAFVSKLIADAKRERAEAE